MSKIGVAAIKLEDMGRASRIDNVDDALVTLMAIADIETGDIAGLVFSGFDWTNATQSQRVDKLAEWIRTERAYEND